MVKGTARPPTPRPLHTPAVEQAQRAGTDQRAGPKASGIKAEWPRFGTKRGAQPASPTAARRDGIGLVSRYSAGANTEPQPELGTSSAYIVFRPTMTASIGRLSRRFADNRPHSDLSRPEG